MKWTQLAVAASLSTLMTSSVWAASAEQAQALKAGILQAKAKIDQAISATGAAPGSGNTGGGFPGGGFPGGGFPGGGFPGGGFPGGGFPGGGHGPWFTAEGDELAVAESDALALPIYVQASGNLFDASSQADNANIHFLQGQIALANFEFANACAKMGISRSQIARANLAALQPPLGFLAPFGPQLADVVVNLNQLRAAEGCP